MPATSTIAQGIQQSSSAYNALVGISGERSANGTPAYIAFDTNRPTLSISIFARFSFGIVL